MRAGRVPDAGDGDAASVDEALTDAERDRLPGRAQAAVARRHRAATRRRRPKSPAELALCFEPFPIDDRQHAVLRARPRHRPADGAAATTSSARSTSISVTGCLDRDGEVLALEPLPQGAASRRAASVSARCSNRCPSSRSPSGGRGRPRRARIGRVRARGARRPDDGAEYWAVDLNPRGLRPDDARHRPRQRPARCAGTSR